MDPWMSWSTYASLEVGPQLPGLGFFSNADDWKAFQNQMYHALPFF